MTAVGHVIPAIPACPVRPKSGHSANARATPAWEPQVFVDRHRLALSQSTRGGGTGGSRGANSCKIGFPLFAYRSRVVARVHSSAVLAASSRSSATRTWMRASRISGLSGIAVAILKQRAQLERWTQTTVRHL